MALQPISIGEIAQRFLDYETGKMDKVVADSHPRWKKPENYELFQRKEDRKKTRYIEVPGFRDDRDI
ncbi:MAG: hypothetical protein WC533_03200 [Candidatus Pacearchaeota archaeon]